jgi:NADPH:quinone reductase-like Zn-dependent oxidoreductase
VRAALIRELGGMPEVDEAPEPEPADGEVVVEVLAAALNPIDVNVSAGRFHGGHPEFPYVPGCEGVGRVAGSGRVVWALGSIGLRRDGTMAERVAVREDELVDVPAGADPALASALGIAGLAGWMPLSWRAPVREGETVLVLGATGTVGLVAVQAAKLLGAGRVVAAGRNASRLERARELGADEVVALDGDLREAVGDGGANLVVDPLWGEPATAALEVCAPRARVVQLGQSAGPTATVTSAAVRGKMLDILGFNDYAVPRDVLAREYRRLVEHAVAGRIRVDLERVPLDGIADAWRRQADGSAGHKLVIEPA